MRSTGLSLLAAVALTGMLPLDLDAQPFSLEGFAWRSNPDAARKVALDQGKPLLIVFR